MDPEPEEKLAPPESRELLWKLSLAATGVTDFFGTGAAADAAPAPADADAATAGGEKEAAKAEEAAPAPAE